MRDVFYKLQHLNLMQKEELLREAKKLSYACFIDEKDEDYKRVPSKITFEEIIQKMDEKCHYVFIERNLVYGDEKTHLEIGFCTMGEKVPGDWFLFIEVEMSHLSYFKEKYNLVIL